MSPPNRPDDWARFVTDRRPGFADAFPYEVVGTHIQYWDDKGVTADADFIDGVLHRAGMVLYRQT